MVKFGFSEKATKFEKIFVVLLTRASCSVRTTAYSELSIKRTGCNKRTGGNSLKIVKRTGCFKQAKTGKTTPKP